MPHETHSDDTIHNPDQYLFDSSLLLKLDHSNFFTQCNLPNLSDLRCPEPGFLLRPLHIKDYEKGFLELLSLLTVVDEVSPLTFEKRFISMKKCACTYFVLVVEHLDSQKIVGTTTLVVEQKFIHKAGIRGRIEDVVVSSEYRGRKLGHTMLATLTLLGKYLGCYKLSLECKDRLISYYETFGFKKDLGNNYMVLRFDKPAE